MGKKKREEQREGHARLRGPSGGRTKSPEWRLAHGSVAGRNDEEDGSREAGWVDLKFVQY